MNKNDKWEAFKASCKVYMSEKETLSLYHSKNAGDDVFYQFLQDDIKFVESTFRTIELECGTAAKVIMWLLYVKGKTQQEIADQYGLTRRSLQVSLYKWRDEVFKDDQ